MCFPSCMVSLGHIRDKDESQLKDGLAAIDETCLIFTMRTLASSFPVPNKTRPVPSSPQVQLLGAIHLFLLPGYISFIVCSHFGGVTRTANSFAAVLEF